MSQALFYNECLHTITIEGTERYFYYIGTSDVGHEILIFNKRCYLQSEMFGSSFVFPMGKALYVRSWGLDGTWEPKRYGLLDKLFENKSKGLLFKLEWVENKIVIPFKGHYESLFMEEKTTEYMMERVCGHVKIADHTWITLRLHALLTHDQTIELLTQWKMRGILEDVIKFEMPILGTTRWVGVMPYKRESIIYMDWEETFLRAQLDEL